MICVFFSVLKIEDDTFYSLEMYIQCGMWMCECKIDLLIGLFFIHDWVNTSKMSYKRKQQTKQLFKKNDFFWVAEYYIQAQYRIMIQRVNCDCNEHWAQIFVSETTIISTEIQPNRVRMKKERFFLSLGFVTIFHFPFKYIHNKINKKKK